MKYIMFDRNSFLIFPNSLTHAEVANGKKVDSAGFVNIGVDVDGTLSVTTRGESSSLQVKSNPSDGEVIRRTIESGVL